MKIKFEVSAELDASVKHGMQYKQGWVDAYFTPMNEFFKS